MAIQLPNNKISRTLPEQVGFNSAKIEEIIKFLNESGLKDLVISVDAASGTLTPEQLAIAELSPSYVLYGGKVYVKALEDLTNIDYFQVGVSVSGSTEYQASIERVRVVRDTRAYAVETVNLFESYTSDQVDTLLSGLESVYAKLSGASFTGPITAPSIIENMSGYTFTKTASALTPTYAGVVKNGNKITFVLSGSVQFADNTAETLNFCNFGFPSSVGAQLYEYLLPNNVSVLFNNTIRLFTGVITFVEVPYYVQKSGNTGIIIYFRKTADMIANQKYCFRVEMTFLLSNNLAS